MEKQGWNRDVEVERTLRAHLKCRSLLMQKYARRGLEYAKRNKGLRFHKYQVGDLVAIYKPTANKMELRYEGPYVISRTSMSEESPSGSHHTSTQALGLLQYTEAC